MACIWQLASGQCGSGQGPGGARTPVLRCWRKTVKEQSGMVHDKARGNFLFLVMPFCLQPQALWVSCGL